MKKLWLIVLGILAVAIYLGFNILSKEKYFVESDKIGMGSDEFKILQLSDLHSKSFGKNNVELIKQIDNEKPDIICMTGDMISGWDKSFDVLYNLVEQLCKKYPVYFSIGNHEEAIIRKKNYELINKLKSYGAIVLDNEKVTITKNDITVNIYGLSIDSIFYSTKKIKNGEANMNKGYIEEKIGVCNKEEYNVLLAHNCLYFEEYAKWGADLVLSGHVHGGAVRLPLIGGLLSPEVKFFPQYSKGMYFKENQIMVVSAGLGTGRLPVRIFNPPHLPVIIIKGK